MKKSSLEELKKLLDELKTVSKTQIPKKEIYGDSIKTINGVQYIALDDISKGQFITSERYVCTLNNGESIVREKLQKAKKDGSAVIVIPVTNDNQVIVTAEPRVFTGRTVGVGFPAGYIENGEEPHISAIRELQEEVGVIPKYLIPLASFYQDEGISAAKNTAYLALECTEGYEKCPDPGEFIKYFKCNFPDVIHLQEDGYIEGSNSIIAIEKSKPYFDEKGRVKIKQMPKNAIKV